MHKSIFRLLLPIFLAVSPALLAQGQDSTSAERYRLILAEMLPGIYDNANQHYFDKRRQLHEEDRHQRINTHISRVAAPAFGEDVFLWVNTVTGADGPSRSYRLAVLDVSDDREDLVMKHYFSLKEPLIAGELDELRPADLRRTEGCDYRIRRRAGHFHGEQDEGACRFEWDGREVFTANTIEVSEEGLWFIDHKIDSASGDRISGTRSGEPYWLERARVFHCYADIPGVAGGRDIPFERYDGFTLHDKGQTHWFTTRDEEQREIGITLQSVTWHVLNERNGNFNRDSLVLYALEKMDDGSVKNHGYAFTDPKATRIGNNMQWMLVNCAMTPRDQARPEM